VSHFLKHVCCFAFQAKQLAIGPPTKPDFWSLVLRLLLQDILMHAISMQQVYCIDCGSVVSPDAHGNGVGLLVESSMVQLQVFIVKVDAVDELCITRKVVLVMLEDGEVLQDVVLHHRHVLGTHPVLGGGAHKALQQQQQDECQVVGMSSAEQVAV
jgi:hypothetical protein